MKKTEVNFVKKFRNIYKKIVKKNLILCYTVDFLFVLSGHFSGHSRVIQRPATDVFLLQSKYFQKVGYPYLEVSHVFNMSLCLSNIESMVTALKISHVNVVKLLYKIIFDDNYDRKSREKIRKFSGFNFEPESKEYKIKIDKIKNEFSLNQLVTVANLLQISSDGNADDLTTRIVTSLNDLNILKTNLIVESENELSEDEENLHLNAVTDKISKGENSGAVHLGQSSSNNVNFTDHCMRSSASFSDLESFVVPFSGTNSESIETWLDNFEDVASLMNLSDLQKIIFAKRFMQGKAKLFIESEEKVYSYKKLKDLMLGEFGDVTNSADIHEMLSKRKMGHDESIDEYFLNMKKLANKANVEDAALIRYVIGGIRDDVYKKASLYGCNDLIEFRAKLKIYDQMRLDENKSKNFRQNRPDPKLNNSKYRYNSENKNSYVSKDKLKNEYVPNKSQLYQGKSNRRDLVCFSCGGKHLAKHCPDKEKGNKCFVCLDFGHRSFECPKKVSKSEVSNVTVNTNSQIKVLTKFNELSINSLVDTGSQATLLKKHVFDKLNVNKLCSLNSTLSGFGRCQVTPLGYFNCNIEIDSLKCTADVYVVENKVMSNDAIIGLNVLMKGETTISEKGITIKNKCQEVDEINLISILPVDLTFNEKEINIGPSVSNEIKNEVQSLISNYKPQKTKSANVQLKICVKSDEPISQQPRRLPFTEKKIVEAQVAEWLDSGIIENSSSEYCSPVVIVKKKDGSPRVCIDYRRLNKIIVKDRFPLPLIEDILDRLQGARIFSTIDLRNGFFHVDVEKDSRKYTSFVTHEGQYQFLKVPFGLCNSPAVFQRYINMIFRPLINDGIVLPYMDDLIILAATMGEAIERLKNVLNLASEYGLEINYKKSQFLKERIEFLGHVIEGGKIYPSVLKTQAVLNFPEPKNIKQIQSYLGLTGYFRKFINQYSIIARPLSELLKKEKKFTFGEEERHAFMRLKSLLAEKPVLAIYNPAYETELHTDASLEGYGAILLQKSPDSKHFHPIYYMSRKTTDAEKNYSSYELEVLAVIEALKKFRVYLLGIPFKIVTDCEAFQKTMEKRDLATRVARWALLLQEYNYVIEHRPGVKMTHVDALSRYPVNVMCVSVEGILPKVKLAQENDSEIIAIKKLLEIGDYDDYCNRNGVIYKFVGGRELLVVPKNMQTEIIKDAHEKGHTGVKNTEKHLEENYYIPKLRNKIEQIIANCVSCILVNRKRGKKEGLLHPRYKEDVPLHTYHMDYLGPLESTNKNYKHILVIVDAFTKFVWIYPTKSTTSAEVISKLNIQKAIFGNPVQIVTDRGTAFTSGEFAEYCAQEEIKHHTVTTGLPRANGQVERINQIIISVLAKLSIENPSQWYKHTNELQQTLNSTYHRSIDTTPFELMFGTKIKNKGIDRLKELIEQEFKAQFESQREDLRQNAKEQILKIQQENRKVYNMRRRAAPPYKIGDLVAIKRTQFGSNLKLKAKYFGPYKITRVKGRDTYDVTKEGYHEGPQCTTTCAEYIKKWTDFSE